MKARVTVYPRREILDPQGKAIRDALARIGLRRKSRRCAPARASRSTSATDDAAGRRRAARRDVREAARQHRGRGVRDRDPAGRRRMKCGVVVFPGSQLRPRRLPRPQARARAGGRLPLARGATRSRAASWSSCPAAGRTATTCAAAPWRRSRRSWRRSREHAERGGLVLGICNGFQVLSRRSLLPGALRRNRDLRFECRDVHLRVERDDLPFTRGYRQGQVICACRSPTARATTSTSRPSSTGSRPTRQVVFRYVAPGRRASIRGLELQRLGARRSPASSTSGGNVLGLMPHPERCAEEVLGNTDGLGALRGRWSQRRGGAARGGAIR